MGELADILRANLRELAHSQARTLRGIDAELKAAREVVDPSEQNQAEFLRVLLGSGTFMDQYRNTLLDLCKKNGIKRISKLNKSQLTALLEAKGVNPPPKPLERLAQKELVALVKKLMMMLMNKDAI